MRFLGIEFTVKRGPRYRHTEKHIRPDRKWGLAQETDDPIPTLLPEPYKSVADREVERLIKPARLILAVCEEMGCKDFLTDDGIVEVEIRKYESQ